MWSDRKWYSGTFVLSIYLQQNKLWYLKAFTWDLTNSLIHHRRYRKFPKLSVNLILKLPLSGWLCSSSHYDCKLIVTSHHLSNHIILYYHTKLYERARKQWMHKANELKVCSYWITISQVKSRMYSEKALPIFSKNIITPKLRLCWR